MALRESLGAKLRRTRIKCGWRQQALAFRLGVTTSYLLLIEKEKRAPSEALRQKISAWMAERSTAPV
jgi:transcriptional regulator with XRE-family HTH domain